MNGLDEDEIWRDIGLLHGGSTAEPYQQTVTTACHHCVEPACLLGCPVKAYEKDAETGIVYVNAGTIGAEIQLPFGGMKATGNGHREAGTQVLDIFTEWKSVYVDYSGKLQRAQIDEIEPQ